MKFSIHDVGHGFCATLIHKNGNVILWDCGGKEKNTPSRFLSRLGVVTIEYFFVTNYDEDHISDLPRLRSRFQIRALWRNKSISADQLRELKLHSGPLSQAMESMVCMIKEYKGGPLDPAPDFSGANWKVFYNLYGVDFKDTNNISLVTFLECDGTKFIIPGDIERVGWLKLMEKRGFVEELTGVDVFVASHHGREDGYCEEIFEVCKPKVIVFSDSDIKYETQKMAKTYAKHARGIKFKGSTRAVLSTRSDGLLTWNFK